MYVYFAKQKRVMDDFLFFFCQLYSNNYDFVKITINSKDVRAESLVYETKHLSISNIRTMVLQDPH